MSDVLMTPRQVEAEYGLPVQQLANWRWAGAGPNYIKTTPARSGRVKYRRSAIEQWLNEQTVSTRGAA